MDLRYLKKLMKLVAESGVDVLEIEEEGTKIHIAKNKNNSIATYQQLTPESSGNPPGISTGGFYYQINNVAVLYTTAPSVSSFSLIGLIRSSRFTPSHMATAAATNTDE